MSNNGGISNLIYVLIGFVFTIISSTIVIWHSARNASGFGLKCANEVLNNPKVVIDTTYIINKQDTVATYRFIKID